MLIEVIINDRGPAISSKADPHVVTWHYGSGDSTSICLFNFHRVLHNSASLLLRTLFKTLFVTNTGLLNPSLNPPVLHEVYAQVFGII